MGHYDSAYEYDEEEQQKARIKECKRLHKLAQELRREISDNSTRVPQRFVESLEDLSNWLEVRTRK